MEGIQDKDREKQPGKAHLLDLKLPVGWLFLVYGLVLGVYGLAAGKQTYAKSLGLNINLVWGAVLFVFGAIFLGTVYLRKGRGK
jgi:hypothetical protein